MFQSYDDINAFDGEPAIESGLVFVPALAGLGCPHWEPRARGVWLGLSLEHTKAQMVQSVLEGVALRAAEVVQAMDRCIPLSDELLIDGGMSKNPYFTQFLANVTGKVIRSARMPELTGLGTILLASDCAGGKFEAATDFHACSPHGLIDRYHQVFDAAVTISRNGVIT